MKIRNQIFFEEHTDGGGNQFSVADYNGEVTTPIQNSEAARVPEEKTSQTANVDLDALAEKFGGVIASQFKQPQGSAQPKVYTPEEIAQVKRDLKFWETKPEFLQKFNNLETQQQAFDEFAQGIFEQAKNVTQAMLAEQHRIWQEQFQPVHQMLTQRQEAERETRFYQQFPTLSAPEFKPVIAGVAQHLASQGAFNGKSESEAFTILGRGLEQVFQKTNPTFKLDNPKPQARNGNAIPSTTIGSGGGGGNGGAKPATNDAVAILGPVRATTRR